MSSIVQAHPARLAGVGQRRRQPAAAAKSGASEAGTRRTGQLDIEEHGAVRARAASPTCTLRHRCVSSLAYSSPIAQELFSDVVLDLFGSQIQGDLFGAAQWRIYQGAAKEFGSAEEFGSAASDSSPQPHFRSRPQRTRGLPGSSLRYSWKRDRVRVDGNTYAARPHACRDPQEEGQPCFR